MRAYRLIRRAHLIADLQGKRHHGRARETFSVTEYRFGEHVIVDLRPGGCKRCPNSTKTPTAAYVDLVVAHIAGRITE